MTDTAYRVLLVATHPVQYATPIFRKMAQHPKLDILVAFCSLQGATAGTDPGFGIEVAWDVPLLEGYPWVQVAQLRLTATPRTVLRAGESKNLEANAQQGI